MKKSDGGQNIIDRLDEHSATQEGPREIPST